MRQHLEPGQPQGRIISQLHARLVRSLPFTEVSNLFVRDMEKIQLHPDQVLPDECFHVGPSSRARNSLMMMIGKVSQSYIVLSDYPASGLLGVGVMP